MSSGELATSAVPQKLDVGGDPGVATAPDRVEAHPLFASDTARGPDRLDRAAQAGLFAELLAHRRVETPFCLGVFGASGSGKSLFVKEIVEATGRLSDAAGRAGGTGPFVPGVMAVQIDASAGTEPGDLLARGVFDALAKTYPALAAETVHAGADPVRAARDSSEALNEARRQLDTERQALETLNGREARLTETVLFEAAGSRVDAYARRNRSRLDRALRLFGFGSADPVTTYKELIREAADADGPLARLGIGLRALWAYQGQTRLIVWAIVFGLIAWGATTVLGDQATWLGQLRDMGDRAAPLADWAQAHVHWLRPVHTVAVVLAIVCLAWNLLRATRFVLPIFKGVSMLRLDVEARRRDLNGLVAHQTRRVDALAAEVETAARRTDEAEHRAGAHKAAGLGAIDLSGGRGTDFGKSEPEVTFFANLGRAMENSTGSGAQATPGRIVVVIDGLDQLAHESAAAVLKTARRLLGRGFATVVSADRGALASGFAEADPALAAAHLARSVQLGYNLGTPGPTDGTLTRFARQMIDGAAQPRDAAAPVDPQSSALDRPWFPREAEAVAALAPFAGEAPRAVKRYVNLYRVARADPRLRDAPAPVFTALALALALDHQGFPEDLAELRNPGQWEGARDLTVLRQALAAAQAASGEPVELTQAQRGFDVARHYSARE